MSTVRETCACGATFDYTSNATYNADTNCYAAARYWREQHRHETPTPLEAVLVGCGCAHAPTEPVPDLDAEPDDPFGLAIAQVKEARANVKAQRATLMAQDPEATP